MSDNNIDPRDLVDRLRADLEAARRERDAACKSAELWAESANDSGSLERALADFDVMRAQRDEARERLTAAEVCVGRLAADVERLTRERDAAIAPLGDHRASIGAHKLRTATDERDAALELADGHALSWALAATRADELRADLERVTRERDAAIADGERAWKLWDLHRVAADTFGRQRDEARGALLALVEALSLDDTPRRAAIDAARAQLRAWGLLASVDAVQQCRELDEKPARETVWFCACGWKHIDPHHGMRCVCGAEYTRRKAAAL